MRRRTLTIAMLLLALAGCANQLPPQADPARGREALTTVLETWARGGAPGDLKKASPAVVASDPDWEDGCKLIKYEIAPADGRAGVDLRVGVMLTLKSPKGKTVQRNTFYVISTHPVLTVVRNDPDS